MTLVILPAFSKASMVPSKETDSRHLQMAQPGDNQEFLGTNLRRLRIENCSY